MATEDVFSLILQPFFPLETFFGGKRSSVIWLVKGVVTGSTLSLPADESQVQILQKSQIWNVLGFQDVDPPLSHSASVNDSNINQSLCQPNDASVKLDLETFSLNCFKKIFNLYPQCVTVYFIFYYTPEGDVFFFTNQILVPKR